MKAWVLHGIGDIRFEDVEKPAIWGGNALVRVKCASICSSDLSRVYGTGAYHYPIILGHEFSGIVEECADKKWIGKQVSIFPLLPCFACESCKEGHYETCSDYSYIGSRRDGGFAEFASVPIWNLCSIPDDVTFEQAALFEPAAVALHAAKMLDVEKCDKVAVVGNGAIGLLVQKWLSILGVSAEVFGRNADYGREYSAVFEVVGSKRSLETCVEITKSNGQLILVGNPEDSFSMNRDIYWNILRKQLSVRGSWNSSYQSDWEMLVQNVDRLKLDSLISHRYDFAELDKALEMMYMRTEKRCKVVVNLTFR